MNKVNKSFALLDRFTGDELFPYMKRQKSTNRFGFAVTRPGEQDRYGKGHYTTDIKEVIRRVVIDGWNVRVKTTNKVGRQREGTLGIGKTANADYWVAPEFLDLVKTAPVQPRTTLLSEKSTRSGLNIPVPPTTPETLGDEQSEQTLDEDIDFASKLEYPLEGIQQRAIKTRRGQPGFRKRLLAAYGNKCAVTGCEVLSVLEAAHIIPHGDETDWDTSNGLPLRADVHTLFDLRLLAVSPDYRMHISRELAGSDYEKLHGQTICLPRRESAYP